MEIVIPDERTEKYQTKFLPITDDDLLKLEEKKPEVDMEAMKELVVKKDVIEKEEEEESEVARNIFNISVYFLQCALFAAKQKCDGLNEGYVA